ncbi:MAG: 16S rRNA (guanine(527)-N(7))-methyltransferase RsmG [Mycoplasmataceae bacterium]|nr:16S rRNA (guanine(527)-N(7))-methyltransferase RsmG [Mycoplasmataceae bacterium]MBR4025545.1 16S rRNA (guanine(527)-N(7))-methyltransferase RsmG [Mycoplasmataceae bacterium]
MFLWEKKVFDYVNNEQIYQKIKLYVDLVLEQNKNFNLTGFDEEKIWIDGIYQSIVLLDKFIDYKNKNKIHLLDIGAGAGFPSIPFFIFSNNKIANLTIYEPIKKRCIFLNLVKEKLNLENLNIVNKRIEDSSSENEFDYIVARAVMPLNMLIEVSYRCGKNNSNYIFLKSKDVFKEIENSQWIIKQFSIDDLMITNVELEDDREHNIVTYSKKNQIPKNFPRKWSEIKKGKN